MKIVKTLVVSLLIGSVAVCSLSANGKKIQNKKFEKTTNCTKNCNCNNKEMNKMPRMFRMPDMKGRPDMMGKMNGRFNFGKEKADEAIIAQVSSVDKDSFTVKDADGKSIKIAVTPFTVITASTTKGKSSNISELKENDWVRVKVEKTETETKVARKVFVKK